MKKTFILSLITALFCGSSIAQTIKNSSFETWVNDTDNYLVPQYWSYVPSQLKNNMVKRVTGASSGSYAVQLGSYKEGSKMSGGHLTIRDTINMVPGALSFDYKVQNNNTSFFSSLSVEIYFYDVNDNFVKNYTWNSPFTTNNSTYKTGTISFSKTVIATAHHYIMNLDYYNIDGETNEYGVFDNLRFSSSANTSIDEASTSKIEVYPNPASNTLFFANLPENVNAFEITGIDGKVVKVDNCAGLADISSLSAGIYFVAFYGVNNELVQREKFVVVK